MDEEYNMDINPNNPGFVKDDNEWLEGERVRLAGYDEDGKPIFEYNPKYYDKWADEA
jgi:hypothetical protein